MKKKSMVVSLLSVLVIGILLVIPGSSQAASKKKVPAPAVFEINDHMICFYLGRGLTPPSPVSDIEGNWVDAGSWDLGGCTYVIYKGDKALIYDTMTYPSEGQWVRDYMAKEKGIKQFTVVLSHWHLDHIAGNPSYKDSPIISLDLTRDALIENKEAIESGTLWGPPALEVVLPNITFQERTDIYLDDLKIELHHFNIHSTDGNLIYIPSDKTLLCGDTLEDTVTYMVAPEDIPTHITELQRLKEMDIEKIYPNHGDPNVIKNGGYTKTFIDAMIEYDTNMMAKVKTPGYLAMPIEKFIPNALADKSVSIWEPYRIVHENNLKLVYECYK